MEWCKLNFNINYQYHICMSSQEAYRKFHNFKESWLLVTIQGSVQSCAKMFHGKNQYAIRTNYQVKSNSKARELVNSTISQSTKFQTKIHHMQPRKGVKFQHTQNHPITPTPFSSSSSCTAKSSILTNFPNSTS